MLAFFTLKLLYGMSSNFRFVNLKLLIADIVVVLTTTVIF